MSPATLDHDPVNPPTQPDPHGEAALVLVESLLHGLLARSALSLGDAIDILESAIDVQVEIDRSRGKLPAASSTSLLSAIADSLSTDLPPDRVAAPPVAG